MKGKIAILGAAAVLLAGCTSSGPDNGPIRNVLVIMADDHARYVAGAYGNDIVRTPNLDRLAGAGVRFDRAFCNSPVCTASRQSIITGKLPHASGVTLLNTPLAEEQITIADHMSEHGFRTAAIGKMHFNSNLQHGFQLRLDGKEHDEHLKSHPARKPPPDVPVKPRWRPFRDPARVWLNADGLPGTGYPQPGDWENQGLYEKDFLGTWLTERAADFIRENKDQRFLMWLSYYEPHSPYNFPVEYAGRHDPSRMPVPSASREDERWIPEIFRPLTREDRQGIVRSYYQSVEYLDANIGRILESLKEQGLENDTLVLYFADHGYLLGHHGRFEKHSMWDEAIRVPLVVYHPRFQARTAKAMVELVDVVPTILDMAGLPPIPGQQGRSLRPVLEGGADEHRDVIFSEYAHDNLAAVRDDRWKYFVTSGLHDLALGYQTGKGAPGFFEALYDLATDPAETKNLAADPAHAETLDRLRTRMLRIFRETHPYAAQAPAGQSREALEWFLVPVEERKKM